MIFISYHRPFKKFVKAQILPIFAIPKFWELSSVPMDGAIGIHTSLTDSRSEALWDWFCFRTFQIVKGNFEIMGA
jgi:hypothetical protein